MKLISYYLSLSTRPWRRGHTLVELVVYVAVFAFLSVVVVNAILAVTGSFLAIRAERNVNAAASTAMERVAREVRLAEGVDILNSTFDAHPGRIILNTTDINGIATTAEFYVESGQLKVREGGVDAGTLTPVTIVIDAFVARLITAGSVQAVKIELTIHDARSGNVKAFYNTALLRGSY